MGMKQRRCNGPCKQKRRFDADRWHLEGWTVPYVDHPFIRWCPRCSGGTLSANTPKNKDRNKPMRGDNDLP